ncbi:MAG: hypothetical protein DRJ15_00415 [Bacteroidetes bacterium]|nr:MAG: hypothetical protein DRJ15_00415 [Bacteroidota bacterium]
MKKINLLVFIGIVMLSASVRGQDIPVWKKMHYLSEEEMKLPNNNLKNFVPTDPPAHPVRMVAEYEQMQSVLVRYPFGIPTSLIIEMSQDCGVTTLVANSSQQNLVTSIYQSGGANMDNIDFIIAPTDSWWTRDYGPWFVIDGNGEFGVCDFPYNRPRPNDDEVPVEVAAHLGINLFGMSLEQTGGNWMCTGDAQASSTDLVWEENPGLNHQDIQDMVDDYLGVEQYHVLPDPLGDYIKHVDCWGKFLGVNKVLIGQVLENDPRYDDFEYVADYFANTLSDWGMPYEVFRVYTPGYAPNTPYTNSLILNKKVFVPVTGSTYDDDALAVYEAAMPGYEIHGILYGEWYNTDALHCRTKGIADIGMLHIDHFPLHGNIQLQDEYNITATITNYSGMPLYPDSLQVFYQVNGGAFESIVMAQSLGNQYSASIPYMEEGTLVGYYIHAADESGRSTNHPLIGAPDPHEFTVVQMLQGLIVMPDTLLYTTIDQCIEGQEVKIYPDGVEEVTVDFINQMETDIFYWWSEPEITFPYTIPSGDSLVLTVYIGIPVDQSTYLVQDTMFIECGGGDEQVLIMVDEDIISSLQEPEESFNISGIYPNPFDRVTNINLSIQQDQHIRIDVLDINGKLVSTIADMPFAAGDHQVQWDGSQYPAGIYYVTVKGDQLIGTAKLIKR